MKKEQPRINHIDKEGEKQRVYEEEMKRRDRIKADEMRQMIKEMQLVEDVEQSNKEEAVFDETKRISDELLEDKTGEKDKETRDAVNKLVDAIVEHNSKLRPTTVGVSGSGSNGEPKKEASFLGVDNGNSIKKIIKRKNEDNAKIEEIKGGITLAKEPEEVLGKNEEYVDLPGIVLDENGKFLRFADQNNELGKIKKVQNEKESQEPTLVKIENNLNKPEELKEPSPRLSLKSKIGAWFNKKNERKMEVPKIDKNEEKEKEPREEKSKIENNLKVEDILKVGTDYFSKRDLRRFKVMGYGKNMLGRKIVKLEFTYKDARGYTHKEKWTSTEKEILEDFKDGKIQIYEKAQTPEFNPTGVLATIKDLPEKESPEDSLDSMEPIVKDSEVEIKKVGNSEGEAPTPTSEVLSAEKVVREIEKDEYEGMKNDLRMIDRLLKESKGIVNISESDFKSEESKEIYKKFKHIPDGRPVSFNKDELLKIGDQLEKSLVGSKIITREEIEKREKDKERQKITESELVADIKMLNKLIQESKGIAGISESSFKSEKGKEIYQKLRHIPDSRPASFNKDELIKIGDNLESFLIELQKKSK